MSAPRPLAADRVPFVVPTSTPRWCRDLDISEVDARDLFEPKNIYTIGPRRLTSLGFWVAGVSCDGPGRPFVVRDQERKRCAILPRWSQAAAMLAEIAADYEAAVRREGDVRIPGPKSSAVGRNAHRPRKPTDGIRLDPRRRREVVATFQRERQRRDPSGSPLTGWEAETADAILDVLHSRARGLSIMEADMVGRIMAKLAGPSR